jgi:hypothetical protein
MDRMVKPELLDALAPRDPLAEASRKDLWRLNAWMGNARTMARALDTSAHEQAGRLVDLGAGDGSFLYRVVLRLRGNWKRSSALLLDRLADVSPERCRAFAELGWRIETVKCDVFDWLRQPGSQEGDTLVANLFLHHFSKDQLAELLCRVERGARGFVAIEPRRAALALAFSHLVGLIGCNRVTRHDAPVSVRAGFAEHELSQLWPGNGEWSLEERPVGLFSHLFVARRKGAICRR